LSSLCALCCTFCLFYTPLFTSCTSILVLTHPSVPHTYTLSLHDALPISSIVATEDKVRRLGLPQTAGAMRNLKAMGFCDARLARSEEHTSELQSRFDLVCRLLLEKKNKN